MGVSANLVVNSRYNVTNIETLLKALGAKLTGTRHKGDHSFVDFIHNGEPRMMYVAHSSEKGGVHGLLLSLGSNDHATEILTSIAKVVGGFLQPSDVEDVWREFHDPHQGNARFILTHQILTTAETDSEKMANGVALGVGYKRRVPGGDI